MSLEVVIEITKKRRNHLSGAPFHAVRRWPNQDHKGK